VRLAPPQRPLDDGVVTLRPVGAEDVAAVTAACQDPEIARWTTVPWPYSETDARGWIEAAAQEHAEGRGVNLVVVDAASGELLGAIGLMEYAPPVCRVGYWVQREARGRGVAPRALALLSRWALAELDLPRLELITDPDHRASQRVAEKAGFTREGVLRHAWEQRGEWKDVVLFSLVPADLAGDGERR
jgi:RimJ/RimL family protein N-acetyltransferase